MKTPSRNLQSRHGPAMATPWSKVAMANGFGGVEYPEYPKLLWPCHGQPLPHHGQKSPWRCCGDFYISHPSKLATFDHFWQWLAMAGEKGGIYRNLQSHCGPAITSDGQKSPWPATVKIWLKSRVLDMSLFLCQISFA